MKISDCCDASPRNDIEEEMCLCSDCGDHCEYIEYEQEIITEKWDREFGDNAWCLPEDMGDKS